MYPKAIITGVGCVSPNGVGKRAFVEACVTGQSGLRRPPEGWGERTSSVGQVVDFEPADHLDAADLKRVPPVVPLALAAAREAVEQASLDVNDEAASRRVGLVLGTGGGGLSFVEEQYARLYTGRGGASPYSITGGTHGNLAGELSIALGLRGPSHVVSTGCASSTDALGYVLMLIRSGRCDAVVCGGADAPIAPGILRGFERMGVVSTRLWDDPTQSSRPFTKTRDGLVLAEGAWMFVVERDGWRQGGEPLGELAGYGSTSDAYHRVRIAPDVTECVRAMSDALVDAGATPGEVDSVNLHGTSTEMNDRLETLAMHKLLGDRARLVPMSATKSLIGHPQGAGGAAGLAAALLSAREGFVHPTINLDDPDSECDLDYCPNVAREATVDLLLCNCIAFGSKNSALAVRVLR
ncbi:MAG: beta-ketoacyl-[acyl-carrier-protein] synthase family protein [Planctomycetota bacterium]